ncbi:MAG TPA: winged helix-turn-helix domain-containing protein [Gammaproteobacteria bacterium]|nr:winged helix-turn-helix domain-containing protein [Gammaproteobacteria bacterium]
MDKILQSGFDVGEYHVVPESGLLIGPDGAHRVCEQLIALLSELAAHPGQTVYRRRIIEDVWHDAPGADRALTRCVSRLRRYLQDNGGQSRYIETLPGKGYRLVASVRTEEGAESQAVGGASRFWALLLELRQRKVCRAALVYAVVVWLVYQVAEIVLPALGAPSWVLAAVVIFGVLGFPVALVLAWTFEITPEGIRIDDTEYRRDHGRASGQWDLTLNAALIALALLLSGQLLYVSLGTLTIAPAAAADQPFRTLALAGFVQADTSAESAVLGRELTAELRHRLRSERGLNIVSLESIGALHRDVPADVEALLLGNVRLDAEKARLTIYIVDRATGHDVWSGTLEQPREPVSSLSRRLAGSIAELIPASPLPPTETARVGQAGATGAVAHAHFSPANP